MSKLIYVEFQVESSLMHFWCSMPWHVTEILQEEAIIEIVAAFDTILYKVLHHDVQLFILSFIEVNLPQLL